MTLTSLAFYLFATVAVASSFMVISSRNPVYSVLYLILTFFNSAGLFVLLGAEFLALILVVVYVGAVAVLFLFVVMMLDIDFAELSEGFLQYMPIGATVGLMLLLELLLVFGASSSLVDANPLPQATPDGICHQVSLAAADWHQPEMMTRQRPAAIQAATSARPLRQWAYIAKSPRSVRRNQYPASSRQTGTIPRPRRHKRRRG